MPAGFPRSTAFRTFSVLSKARAAARSLEPHPFGRVPETMDRAKADWGKQFKKAAVTTSFFLPTIGTFLAWPYLTGKALNGSL